MKIPSRSRNSTRSIKFPRRRCINIIRLTHVASGQVRAPIITRERRTVVHLPLGKCRRVTEGRIATEEAGELDQLSARKRQVVVLVEIGTRNAEVNQSDAGIQAVVDLEVDTTVLVGGQVGLLLEDTRYLQVRVATIRR